mmetsp:Transcript_83108/g.149955  ORF Transcript_83108/g.149955 Transcript_83108/m.149955 type:complete len:95 (-) Transcript_83108:23-307(-)
MSRTGRVPAVLAAGALCAGASSWSFVQPAGLQNGAPQRLRATAASRPLADGEAPKFAGSAASTAGALFVAAAAATALARRAEGEVAVKKKGVKV